MEKLKVLELFAGIGACSKALERLNIPHEIVDAVEIDKKTRYCPKRNDTYTKNKS